MLTQDMIKTLNRNDERKKAVAEVKRLLNVILRISRDRDMAILAGRAIKELRNVGE